MKKRLIVITGPTATGKTALSVALAEKLNGEIISADSMQIYKGMDIGTAKVSPEEARGIPHHMVDVAEPWEDFSVSRWVDMAAEACEDIFARGLCLPSDIKMTEKEQNYVIDVIKSAFY